MQVRAFLADAVESTGGKLSMLGAGWNRLHAPGFPATHPRMAVGVFVTVHAGDARTQRVTITMEGPDGQARPFGMGAAGDPRTTLEVNVEVPGSVDDIVVPIALNLDALTFERPGGYAFSIQVDGNEEERLEFTVAQGTTAPGGEEGRPGGPLEPGTPPTTSAGYL
jgi:hypothetical protein